MPCKRFFASAFPEKKCFSLRGAGDPSAFAGWCLNCGTPASAKNSTGSARGNAAAALPVFPACTRGDFPAEIPPAAAGRQNFPVPQGKDDPSAEIPGQD